MNDSTPWYANAIVYGVDVGVFLDTNGDGVGDFRGLTRRLDYLTELGVTCLWLLPFYPGPHQDNGYDVAEYCGVDPRFGTLDDFGAFVDAAMRSGLRVIIDLVANHTSHEHPWFQQARQDPQSPFRDYYIWARQPPADYEPHVVFPGVEESNWAFDAAADAYFWHTFYSFEPDLNHANPAVREEFRRIMDFWLDFDIDGFRIDAAPYLGHERTGVAAAHTDVHDVLRGMRRVLAARRGDGVLLGEADTEADDLAAFFGDGDALQLLMNFLLDNYLFLALAQQRAEPIGRALQMLPRPPRYGQWLNFLRNLDELDLERLSEEERAEVYAAFAPEERMRVYGRGIRRRLAPMLDGDRRRIELAFSLLFAMPGTPLLVYGDEIGMGDDLSLPERVSVRTPMHWSAAENGGFSSAPADRVARRPVMDGPFGAARVNVADQRRDAGSLLAWMRRLINVRRSNPAIGAGSLRVIDSGDPSVFACRYDAEGGSVIAIHNLGERPARVALSGGDQIAGSFVPIFGALSDTPDAAVANYIDLPGYGYCWLRANAL